MYTATVGFRGHLAPAEAFRSSFRAEDGYDAAEWSRQNNPLLVADVLDDAPQAQWFRLVLHQRFGEFCSHMRSWMSVPLHMGDRLVGAVLNAYPMGMAGAQGMLRRTIYEGASSSPTSRLPGSTAR